MDQPARRGPKNRTKARPKDVIEVMKAFEETQFVTREVNINRGMSAIALVAFGLESTGKVYLATVPNPIEIQPLPPESKLILVRFRLAITGEEFPAGFSGLFSLIPSDWQTFSIPPLARIR